MKQPSKPAAEADEAEYKPTPAETDALKAYLAANDTRAPRIKVTSKGVAPDHVSRGVAPGIEMPRDVEAERVAVPSAGRERD